MTTKEKYFEIKNALQEQIKTNSVERKAYKPAFKCWQSFRSSLSYRWDYWNHPEYKTLDVFTCDLNPLSKTETTVLHILYNRIRNRPAHTGSFATDEFFLSSFKDCTYGRTTYKIMIIALEKKHSVTCKPTEERIEMFEADY